MEKYETLLSYISTILILLFTTITYIIKFIEKQREIKRMNDLNLIENELERLIVEAEKLFDTGNVKEKFVIDRLRSFASDYKIKLNFNEMQERIEKLIHITKEINTPGGTSS